MTTDPTPTARIDEIADGIHRISVAMPPSVIPGGFTFNQFLIVDEEPLLFHTGPRGLFPLVRGAIERVLPLARLRHVTWSHFEADECGACNDLLAAAPAATAGCSRIGAMTSAGDFAARPPRAFADGEELRLGHHTVRWLDTPHMPHGWDCGCWFEVSTRTLLCGDLFTQGGAEHAPITERDILAPALAVHTQFDYFAHSRDAGRHLARLAATKPARLACMHGASWRGDGAALLATLARELGHGVP